jgi:adenylosuccinate lyase
VPVAKKKTPLDSRYSSAEMKKLFGARSRHSTWRQLWFWLAEAEKEVGLEGITDEALAQMKEHLVVTDEDFAVAAVEEKKRRHDVVGLGSLLVSFSAMKELSMLTRGD